jgi:polyhydroxyalkanoate synthesis regulator phasin
MTNDRLISLALGEFSAEHRQKIMDELMREDASVSHYGWHEFLAKDIREVWADLDLGQRLVAYVAARDRSECHSD